MSSPYLNNNPDNLDLSNWNPDSVTGATKAGGTGNILIGYLNQGLYRIIQIYTTDGSNLSFKYPNGDDSFSYIWSQRSTYTYSQRID